MRSITRKAINHHQRSIRSAYYPPVPHDRRIGEPVWLKRGGQRTILAYEDGEEIHYGERVRVNNYHGGKSEYVFLYNAQWGENQLYDVSNFPHLFCKCLDYKDSWEEGISIKFGMRIPKSFTERYYDEWWDYIHNSNANETNSNNCPKVQG